MILCSSANPVRTYQPLPDGEWLAGLGLVGKRRSPILSEALLARSVRARQHQRCERRSTRGRLAKSGNNGQSDAIRSRKQFVVRMSQGMVLTIIDVNVRVFVDRSWACLKDCCQLREASVKIGGQLFRLAGCR